MAHLKPVAIITGAAQGIGRRTAEILSEKGYALALNDLKAPDELASSLKKRGLPVLAVAGDVSLERDVERIHEQVLETFGRADVLVNNAGISSIRPALDIDAAEWRRVMDVNLLGPFLMCRAFGRDMVAQGQGSIINIASVAGLLGIAERAAYNASKHGLIGLTRTLAAEWGGRGVRVNAVCPGWVKTPMDDSATSAGHYVDADIEGRVPMGRFATTEDIAQAILFLADPTRSGFINGHTLSVDGGWFADGSWESLRRRQQGSATSARSSN
jgi:NAD(P)-dependent dehydrogenase (short-subunit alcohol dehydrogenase family)